ncbi:MAG: hypothetical protein ACMXYM_03845 [Candidatus Woesearchaeota archaeon]
MHGARKAISAILGLIFLALGAIPLLHNFGVIGFTIPAWAGIPMYILAVVGGVFLLIDALKEQQEARHSLSMPTAIVGLVVLAFGLVPLLFQFGAIGFSLPGFLDVVSDYLFVAAGILLLIGATQGF